MRSLSVLIYAFIVCILLEIATCAKDYIIILERVENIAADNEEFINFSEMNVVRKGSNYFLHGNFSVLQDLDDSISVELKTECSPLGDSRFIKHPFALEKQSLCEHFSVSYKKYMGPSLNDHSNITPDLCPIPKGRFYINYADVVIDPFPDHVNRGLWKLEERFYKGANCVGGVRVLLYVKDKN